MRRVKDRFPRKADDDKGEEDDEVEGPPSQLAWVRALDEGAKLNERPTPEMSRKRSWKDMVGPGNGAKTKGAFTAAEDELLRSRLRQLFDLRGWSWEEGMRHMLMEKAKGSSSSQQSPWLFVSEILPDRRIESVIQRVQGHIYSWPRKGRWTLEENKQLLELFDKYPGRWRMMSDVLKRYWRTIRDHYNELMDKGMLAVLERLRQDRNAVLQRVPRRFWTRDEEAALLKSIRQITGLQYPLSHIPWLFVAKSTRTEIPNRTSSDLRLHYNLALLPRAATVSSWKVVCKRQGLRHLKKLIKMRPDIHWTEVDFTGVLPFWPITTMKTRMKNIVLDYGGFKLTQMDSDRATKFLDDGSWRQVVTDASRALDLRKWRVEDLKTIESYLARLRQFNGGDRHALGTLPQDTEAEALRNYSRRKLRELKAFETSSRTARIESGWRAEQAQGASGVEDYVNYHLEAALDLIDEGEVVINKTPDDAETADKPDKASEHVPVSTTSRRSSMSQPAETEVPVEINDAATRTLFESPPPTRRHSVSYSTSSRKGSLTGSTPRHEVSLSLSTPPREEIVIESSPLQQGSAIEGIAEVTPSRRKSLDESTPRQSVPKALGRKLSVDESTPSTQAGSSPFVVIPAVNDDDEDRFFQ